MPDVTPLAVELSREICNVDPLASDGEIERLIDARVRPLVEALRAVQELDSLIKDQPEADDVILRMLAKAVKHRIDAALKAVGAPADEAAGR